MFRMFVVVCLLWIFALCISTLTFATENMSFEITQVISETKQVAKLIDSAGGKEDANRLLKRVSIVETNFRAGENENLRDSLQILRAEVLRRHAYFNIALAGLVGKQNTPIELKAIEFINKAEYLLKSIEKRINKIRGDK